MADVEFVFPLAEVEISELERVSETRLRHTLSSPAPSQAKLADTRDGAFSDVLLTGAIEGTPQDIFQAGFAWSLNTEWVPQRPGVAVVAFCSLATLRSEKGRKVDWHLNNPPIYWRDEQQVVRSIESPDLPDQTRASVLPGEPTLVFESGPNANVIVVDPEAGGVIWIPTKDLLEGHVLWIIRGEGGKPYVRMTVLPAAATAVTADAKCVPPAGESRVGIATQRIDIAGVAHLLVAVTTGTFDGGITWKDASGKLRHAG